MTARRIASLPGAFRPPHRAHDAAIAAIAARDDIDEVVVLIANRSRVAPGTPFPRLAHCSIASRWRATRHWQPVAVRVAAFALSAPPEMPGAATRGAIVRIAAGLLALHAGPHPVQVHGLVDVAC